MHITEQFQIKSQTRPDKKGNGYATLHPRSLRGFKTDSLVSITNASNHKQVFCTISTDNDLHEHQIGIDYKLRKKLGVQGPERFELEIASRPFPYRVLFWMNHPDDKFRIGIVMAFVSLVIGAAITVIPLLLTRS